MIKSRLLDRFLRYVQVDTTARDDAAGYPSSPGQLELGRMLVAELRGMGIADAAQDEHGIVLATIPSTLDRPAPTIAFCSHLDTSPETPGAQCPPAGRRELRRRRPRPAGRSPAGDPRGDCPELAGLVGRT